jgi:hypothetical protein
MQKKVGAQVDKDIAKREEEEKKRKQQIFVTEVLPELKKIKSSIIHYQKKHSNRKSACFCIWDNKVYQLKNEKAIAINEVTKSDLYTSMFEIIGEEDNNKTYFMVKEEIAIQEAKIHDWLIENYANLKMISVKIKKGEKSLVNMSILGGLSTEFLDKFPGKTPLDFIEYFNVFDSFMINSLKDISEKL